MAHYNAVLSIGFFWVEIPYFQLQLIASMKVDQR